MLLIPAGPSGSHDSVLTMIPVVIFRQLTAMRMIRFWIFYGLYKYDHNGNGPLFLVIDACIHLLINGISYTHPINCTRKTLQRHSLKRVMKLRHPSGKCPATGGFWLLLFWKAEILIEHRILAALDT